MKESKHATRTFELDVSRPLDPERLTAAKARALRQAVQRADAHPAASDGLPALSDTWFLQAARERIGAAPPAKRPISIKLDEDVLAFFRSQGPRYQTQINAVLRGYMNAVKVSS
jgi:uncharacterized protein (DUF4415 family)